MRENEGASGQIVQLLTLAAVRQRLSPFLERNPFSSIEENKTEEGVPQFQIIKPWGDSSLALEGGHNISCLIDVLNEIYLPERLTAIWHADTNRLEVIWTALKLSAAWKEIYGRKFDFKYKGKIHKCEFIDSSDRLLIIAEASRPLSTTDTNFRNLQSFYSWSKRKKRGLSIEGLDKPISFWISNIKWEEVAVIDLCSALNFYLTYYDDRSPTILVHAPKSTQKELARRTRYVAGVFPRVISAKPLDGNLLAFWEAANNSSPMMAFILYYRILEYAASHYIDHTIRQDLLRLISAPDFDENKSAAVEKIVSTVSLKTLDEVPRFKSVVRNNVDPKLIWRDIKSNIDVFSKETRFDGGFVVKPLVGSGEKEVAFCTRGLDHFSDSIRKIRNTLSHGKDQETSGVITPTTRNLSLLRPWVHLIATAAGEVVLYKDVT